jgi:dihydrodiol dehydrogenase / D-xylose 1-dehydrogenase (NADP)
MKPFRWGIMGCGLIAPKFFQALENTGEGRVVAAASKSMRRARRFQKKTGIAQVYDGYAEMIDKEQLDAVYIANTHAEHAAAAALCLNHGIPVLVEKAFTRNAEEAATVIALARKKKLFCMEAMWTRFNPATLKLRELIAGGAIGEIQRLKADFCVRMGLSMKTMPWNRMYSPRLAGGALLDIGVYPLALARMVFGQPPERITGSARMTWTGVDKTSEYILDYSGGRRADLAASFGEHRPREATVTGSSGIIRMPHFSGTDQLIVTRIGQSPETIHCDAPGFEHEIRETHRCLRDGLTESTEMPLDETLETMRTMDALRALWGMSYPGEQPQE